MLIKDTIIDLYAKGHSVQYITQVVYKNRNKTYFDEFKQYRIIDSNNYFTLKVCRNLVEGTILEHLKELEEFRNEVPVTETEGYRALL